MKATAIGVLSSNTGYTFDYMESMSSAAADCPHCGGRMQPNVSHACSKPHSDQPAFEVRSRNTLKPLPEEMWGVHA